MISKNSKLIKKLRVIAKSYGMRLHTKPQMSCQGEYAHTKRTAWINLSQTEDQLVSTFFHELGHHIDYSNGKFAKFYDNRSSLATLRAISLRAERHADWVGQKLCKKYFPHVRYEKAYRNREDVEWLKDYLT